MSFLGAIVFIIIIEILLSISTVYNSIALADALSASGIFKNDPNLSDCLYYLAIASSIGYIGFFVIIGLCILYIIFLLALTGFVTFIAVIAFIILLLFAIFDSIALYYLMKSPLYSTNETVKNVGSSIATATILSSIVSLLSLIYLLYYIVNKDEDEEEEDEEEGEEEEEIKKEEEMREGEMKEVVAS